LPSFHLPFCAHPSSMAYICPLSGLTLAPFGDVSWVITRRFSDKRRFMFNGEVDEGKPLPCGARDSP